MLWDPPSPGYCVQHYAGLTMDKILLSIVATLLYGPLKSACLTFDVSSPVLNDTNLDFMVKFTRNNTDPSKWGVWAFVEIFQDNTLTPDLLDLVPVMVYNQSQLSGIILLHPDSIETNVTLQAFTFNSTKEMFMPFGNKSSTFLLPAAPTITTTVTRVPAFESTSLTENGAFSTVLSSTLTSATVSSSHTAIGTVSGGSSTHTNVIVGATIGSFAFALLTVALLTMWLRRCRRRRIAPSQFIGDKMVRAPYSYSEGFGFKLHSNDGAENA
ncbi:hypothetical protein F5876DRAFT_74931 [Lentinula aff. lateritia]|uniref:Uncharacterized protein n=1 Tax=Lentinula aff. lateritia TaxID=2804960 RepID=A0ACC1U6A8_9AGAR|nr:hypothetical protein F5876DRAFT_74931 [Lentinula aff. lateritia]